MEIKIKCLHCEEEFELTGIEKDELGWHTSCPICGGSFDIDIYYVDEKIMVG